MLTKCANPNCSSRFLYLREGKLFRIEISAEDEFSSGPERADRPSLVGKKPVARVEHYWLCANCAASLLVAYDREHGVAVVPRADAAIARHAVAS